MLQYHKARASTNYSFHVARYLPKSVTSLIVTYLAYIRPFAKLVFRNCFQQQYDPCTRPKDREGRVQMYMEKLMRSSGTVIPQTHEREGHVVDKGYIFCDDESPNECWAGPELSEALGNESESRLNVKIGLWTWRHIIIAITKAHLEEIAPFFARDEAACKTLLETNIYYSIFPWQAGHQPRVNVAVYGLDAAFPGQVQPALLRFYREISKIWHHWLGLVTAKERRAWSTRAKRLLREIGAEDEMDGTDSVRDDNDEGRYRERDGSGGKKRKKGVDSGTQTTPKKSASMLEIKVEDSPTTKGLILDMKERLESVAKIIEMRRASKQMMTELRSKT